jgi:hypothetical protein
MIDKQDQTGILISLDCKKCAIFSYLLLSKPLIMPKV